MKIKKKSMGVYNFSVLCAANLEFNSLGNCINIEYKQLK